MAGSESSPIAHAIEVAVHALFPMEGMHATARGLALVTDEGAAPCASFPQSPWGATPDLNNLRAPDFRLAMIFTLFALCLAVAPLFPCAPTVLLPADPVDTPTSAGAIPRSIGIPLAVRRPATL